MIQQLHQDDDSIWFTCHAHGLKLHIGTHALVLTSTRLSPTLSLSLFLSLAKPTLLSLRSFIPLFFSDRIKQEVISDTMRVLNMRAGESRRHREKEAARSKQRLYAPGGKSLRGSAFTTTPVPGAVSCALATTHGLMCMVRMTCP